MKTERFLRIAEKVARNSKHPQHHLGCVIARGGQVLSLAANESVGRGHAEERACKRDGRYKGATAYVVRLNGCKTSKPCDKCQQILKDAGIASIVFYGMNGQIVEIDCSELH